MLHLHSRFLTKQLFTLSLFLTSQKLSTYEYLWSKFPRAKISGYSFYQKVFFYVIGTLILALCFIYTYSAERYVSWENILTLIVSITVYLIAIEIISISIVNKRILKRIEFKWKQTIKNEI